MSANPYVALLAQSGSPVSEDQRLHLEMLWFLDDRHVPVQVLYDDRLPGWGRRHAWLAQLYYFFKLMTAPSAVVLADFTLCLKMGWALLAAGIFKRHRIIVSICRLPEPRVSRWQQWWYRLSAWACLKSAFRVLVPSQTMAYQVAPFSALREKVRYLAYSNQNLGLDNVQDAEWWPLAHFKPRSHIRHYLESAIHAHFSSN